MMVRIWLSSAALSGLLCVALGAFGAHGLDGILSPYGKEIYETAVLYQMFHTLALLGVGMLQASFPKTRLTLTGWFFIFGMVLFSGSLYLLSITGVKWLGAVTPVGGLMLLTGWATMIHAISKVDVHA